MHLLEILSATERAPLYAIPINITSKMYHAFMMADIKRIKKNIVEDICNGLKKG